jgi:rhamnogalacturonyl hydrolase YesR
MGLARVLEIIADDAPNRDVYIADFRRMADALLALQREDGFWNVSLHDPDHFGGPESSGTAMFAYGFAWGINHGLLDASRYRPALAAAWQALTRDALHPDGFLGYVQSTGADPAAGQPVSFDRQPDFEDYALGAFLLAGTELSRLAR